MPYPDVSGEWSIHQSGGYEIFLDIAQNGGEISGSAVYHLEPDLGFSLVGADPDEIPTVRSMEAHGTVNETHFLFEVSWNNGTRGRYTGAFQEDGALAGVTVDLEHPTSEGTWMTKKQFSVPAPEPETPAVVFPMDLHLPPAVADGGVDVGPPPNVTLG